ncbi:LPXTG cell wall anchor domain-containing protein [Pseudarthrobacter sp. AB1]|uniref:LPXTG cell wall anchor domain-containing protein n=1 Tax=Pseudarthrobacter sp. AB1 TaxID=2138309 RepID=UPI00186BAFCB|nr:LPXTG cell wall anchor domain-containing protein [Pseudarthrobacter sp. AB1]MBE4717190.1 hypothetical protein [Pseudarthrobacter sp. AB1]
MNCNLRRGLLSTLFTGGLLAFGATAASAADTTNGPDLSVSALVSAAASVDTTSLGLLGGPTQSDAADVAAVVDANLGLGDGLLGSTDGSGTDTTNADVAAAADINLGLGLGLGDSILGGTDGALDAAVDVDLGLDTSGVLDDVNVGLDACVIIGGGPDGCGTPGTETTDPGTGTTGDTDTTDPGTGTDGTTGAGTTGITVLPAGNTTGSVSAAVNTTGNTTSQGGATMLAKTGMDASLIPLALILLLAGLLMLKRRRKA